MDWQQARLRRTQASRDLRQSQQHDYTQPADLQMWENKSPIEIRRMLSNASMLFNKPVPPLPEKSSLRAKAQAMDHCSSDTQGRSDSEYETATDGCCEKIQHHHKDSAVAFEHDALKYRINKPASQAEDDVDFNSSRPSSNTESIDSASSTIRFNIQRPSSHHAACICHTCRHIRHQRRKTTMKLTDRLETCRRIMITIRDPSDPSNFKRGQAYGHWLKLARLYVKYETLIDVPINDIHDEDMLAVHFLRAFRAIEKLIEAEQIRFGHLFGEQVAECVAPERATMEGCMFRRRQVSILSYRSSMVAGR